MSWVILLSRVLMAAVFIHAGYGKAMHPSATMTMLEHHNLPLPGLAYAVTLLVEIGGGIAFLLGWKGQAAALVLAVWCVVTAFIGHYPWVDASQMINFMKNLCMAGGFLQVVVHGSGDFSLDRK
jgi:putative oxidoreductase